VEPIVYLRNFQVFLSPYSEPRCLNNAIYHIMKGHGSIPDYSVAISLLTAVFVVAKGTTVSPIKRLVISTETLFQARLL
jgi:hypothetical protein